MTGLTDIPQDQMEEAMQRACDEQVNLIEKSKNYQVQKSKQAEVMEEHEERQIRKANQEKSKLDTKETVDFIIEHYGDVLRKLSKT